MLLTRDAHVGLCVFDELSAGATVWRRRVGDVELGRSALVVLRIVRLTGLRRRLASARVLDVLLEMFHAKGKQHQQYWEEHHGESLHSSK